MKKLSLLARKHVLAARVLIICIRIILIVLACYTGELLYSMDVILSASSIYQASFLLIIIAIAVYPDKRSTSSKKLFYTRKACDFILPLSSFLAIAAMVNNGNVSNKAVFTDPGTYATAVVKNPTAQEILAAGKSKQMLTHKEKRILKREFYKQLKMFAAAKIAGNTETSGKAWKIILAIIAMVGLTFLLASLACSLSCGGSDVAAVVVLAFGLTAIIWGFVAVMKRIKYGPKTNDQPTEQPTK
ncbi:MAG: hypothetical protein JWP81_195 [Ferruginibacter sp.]|nr:hypothetical protein [Ferruginibacter sp.]